MSIELAVSQEMISQYECGKCFPSVQNLLKLSELFGVSCDYILGVSDVKRIVSVKDYTVDEMELLAEFKTLRTTDKAMAKAYIQALSDKQNQ
ncbi:MAG: helix-turn-helix transcriptional regulator [Eubacterium sp.]|nr:helix-turn-helix transcriptional regulator [Eubacterium sp.]